MFLMNIIDKLVYLLYFIFSELRLIKINTNPITILYMNFIIFKQT